MKRLFALTLAGLALALPATALARYAFKLPSDWSGSISPHVDTPVGNPQVAVSKPVDGVVRVTVRTSGPSKVVVSTVSVGYYCS